MYPTQLSKSYKSHEIPSISTQSHSIIILPVKFSKLGHLLHVLHFLYMSYIHFLSIERKLLSRPVRSFGALRCSASERDANEEPPLLEEELLQMKVPWMLQFASDLRPVFRGRRWRSKGDPKWSGSRRQRCFCCVSFRKLLGNSILISCHMYIWLYVYTNGLSCNWFFGLNNFICPAASGDWAAQRRDLSSKNLGVEAVGLQDSKTMRDCKWLADWYISMQVYVNLHKGIAHIWDNLGQQAIARIDDKKWISIPDFYRFLRIGWPPPRVRPKMEV